MSKFVLIDTCVLRELISPVEFSGYLKQIKNWHEQGGIILPLGNRLSKSGLEFAKELYVSQNI